MMARRKMTNFWANVFRKLSGNYRRITSRHNIPYDLDTPQQGTKVNSIVIPTVGEDFIEEALLSAKFASLNAISADEIVIVTDQPKEKFGECLPKIRVVTLDIVAPNPDRKYAQIYKSRMLKIQAPLQASASSSGVLMIDSDLNLLRDPAFLIKEGRLYSSFRKGRMGAKFENRGYNDVPAYYTSTIRPILEDHVNGAFLAATYSTWQRLCPLWLNLFNDTWGIIPDNQPPTDQPPLAVALDLLNLMTINLGDWVNWPVSKKIGGSPSLIPKEVIGAHGGFPLSEWQKYLESSKEPLLFKGQDYTRKIRYLSDAEKNQTE